MAGISSVNKALPKALDFNQLKSLGYSEDQLSKLFGSAQAMGAGKLGQVNGQFKDILSLAGAQDPSKTLGTTAGSTQQPATSAPGAVYSHQATQQSAGKYYQTLDTDTAKLRAGGAKKGAYLSGSALRRVLDEKAPGTDSPRFPELRSAVIKKHGLVQSADGRWLQPATGALTGNVPPGLGNDQAATDVMKLLQGGNTFTGTMGIMGGGLGGLVGSLVTGQGATSLGGLESMGINASRADNSGNIAAAGSMAVGSMGAKLLGFDGMAFSMRKVMNSYAEEMKDKSMIGQIQNPGIPIEDLIFMFMSHMSNKYEKKLRDKMEEANLAEMRQRSNERRTDQARMLGGVASIIPGVGSIIGAGIEYGAAEYNRVHNALDGNQKSSTMLMSEVQMLMHKWKQMNEMLSNLMKAMHDMAMTPIRNIR